MRVVAFVARGNFKDSRGDSLLSASAASDVIKQISSDLRGFTDRDLSEITVEHLFCDRVFEISSRHSDQAMLIAWATDSVERKHLLRLAVGDKDSCRLGRRCSVTWST